MVSFHLRKGRMFSRRAEEQAMATAQSEYPGTQVLFDPAHLKLTRIAQ